MIEKLKKKYAIYEGSSLFIDIAFELLETIGNEKCSIKFFIDRHFKTNVKCDKITMIKNASHWKNVSFSKLNEYDFSSYKYSTNTMAKYHVMVKGFELHEKL